MKQTLEGELLARMFIHASAALNREKQTINELNVFPVPDGDTGTNMSLTLGAAAAELQKKKPETVWEVAAVTAGAMLRGARGNSGVILSLLFRGFAKSVKEMDTLDGHALAHALSKGVTAAYKAVMKPAEGTLLTVSRVGAARAEEAAHENGTVEFVLEQTAIMAERALAQTIEQNPVLKKAGVVDAGGMGYVIILKAMLSELRGVPMPDGAAPVEAAPSAFQAFSTEEITFGYCTEFIAARQNDRDPELLRAILDGMGDSLVLVEDDEIIKVHVHTDNPGKALEEGLKYGALLTVKVENMREQHTELLEAGEEKGAPETPAPPEKKYGFVAVCAGEGLRDVLSELGVDGIISGGQTMNPSTEDILRQINRTPAEIVYVLPNNKNIIMAAQQAVGLAEGKRVIVLPSKTVPEGISAMLTMDYDAEEGDNTHAMQEAMKGVTTMEITFAARDSEFDGEQITQGDYLALRDGQLFGTGESLSDLLDRVADSLADGSAEFINVFYGEDVTEQEAQEAAEKLRATSPEAEITVLNGGQPVYAYIISAE